jgi:hypothetical protein
MKELVKQTNPWASEAESCTTKGRKVVVNRTFVGVVCTLERLLVRGMMVVGHFHQATKRSPREQPNSHRLTVLLHGNSVNTPLRYVGDVTVVLRRCNMGPTRTKLLVPNRKRSGCQNITLAITPSASVPCRHGYAPLITPGTLGTDSTGNPRLH